MALLLWVHAWIAEVTGTQDNRELQLQVGVDEQYAGTSLGYRTDNQTRLNSLREI